MFEDEASQSEGKLLEALMRNGRNLMNRPAELFKVGARDLGKVAPVGNIDFVEDDDAGPFHQGHIAFDLAEVALIGSELRFDCLQVGERFTLRFVSCGVEDVDDDTATLNMAQEVEAESFAL